MRPIIGVFLLLSLSVFQEIAASKGGVCLSDTYTHCFTKMLFRCKEGHEWSALPSHIKAGVWCRKCGNVRDRACISRFDKDALFAKIKNKAAQFNLTILDNEFVSYRHTYNMVCGFGHHVKIRPQSAILSCKVCRKNTKQLEKLNECRTIAESRGGSCLSTEYAIAHTPMEWRCVKEHTWTAKFSHIKDGTWCPYCLNKSESEVRKIFEEICGKEFPIAYPIFLKRKNSSLQLDGFCEELSLAFEYDGEQHYVEFRFHKHNSSLEKQKIRDELKDKLCYNNGISLIRIPYFIQDKKQFIIEELRKVGVKSKA